MKQRKALLQMLTTGKLQIHKKSFIISITFFLHTLFFFNILKPRPFMICLVIVLNSLTSGPWTATGRQVPNSVNLSLIFFLQMTPKLNKNFK